MFSVYGVLVGHDNEDVGDASVGKPLPLAVHMGEPGVELFVRVEVGAPEAVEGRTVGVAGVEQPSVLSDQDLRRAGDTHGVEEPTAETD